MRACCWFLGLILFGLASIGVFAYPAWLLLHPFFGFPFHRIGERVGMLALLCGLPFVARRLGLADKRSLGYGIPRPLFVREALLGLALGASSMAVVVGLMAALGLIDWTPAATVSRAGGALNLARLIALKLSSGLVVAFLEETFLRGAMLTAVEREAGPTRAVVATAALYSATHFFASFHIPAEQVDAWSGITLLVGTLHAFAAPLAIADAAACLFAVGVVLGAVRVATGNIAACIGLHAGWVWVMLVAHELTAPLPTAPLHFLLSSFDGFIGWLVLGWTLLIGAALYRFYASRVAAGTSTVNSASASSR